jgi:hypothetical protein
MDTNKLLMLVLILVVVWLIFGMSNITLIIVALAVVWFLFSQSGNKTNLGSQ